ncbi:hypothetical protein RND71_043406 [Anisodus tanguticus]|uniref:Protein kinase domain-containing protein n=1 Tax=Anisodus tanguticus TaxID=243964 RepID=A0AAE1QRM9_9SOLA|nr:hypothetical protein RND71_043406 [Anisodus tanguticus]
MEDIYQWCRDGNSLQVRVWLDEIKNDMNAGDDHGFSPLHWAAKEGHLFIVQMLLNKGAMVNATNMGNDTALHLASAHGHLECVQLILKNQAEVNAQNEHGNTPLHYACFWGYQSIAELLVSNGALISLCNKYDEIPLDNCKDNFAADLKQLASSLRQNVDSRIQFKKQSSNLTKNRSKDATLSRHSGIPIEELDLEEKLAVTISGETWVGNWQNNKIVAKFLNLGENPSNDIIKRATRSFLDEYPKLRIFSHPNIDKDLTAKINMADTKFSFQDKNKFYHPAWMSPEQLSKKPCEINQKASDMWSFGILLWEIVTRQVPFAEYSPTEIGMKIALEELRLSIPHSISIHLIRLIRICMNEDAGKRPTFEQIIPILEKISRA